MQHRSRRRRYEVDAVVLCDVTLLVRCVIVTQKLQPSRLRVTGMCVLWMRWHCQMHPVAVLEVLETMGFNPHALEAVGQAIVAVDTVDVAGLAAAGLSGRDIIAVRRALDLSVRG